jgi:ADP-heptose:LPS heptosyltransferase
MVFHTGKLGDMVCATPIFRAIKNKYNGCKVVVFGNSINKEILKYNSNVDFYETVSDTMRENIKNINKYEADFAILLTPGFQSLCSLLRSNVKNISVPKIVNGFSPYETKSYRFLSCLVNRVEHKMGNYAPLEYLKLLEIIDIKTRDTRKDIYYSIDADNKIKDILKTINPHNKKMIGLSLSAGNKIKEWGIDKFVKLAQEIIKHHDLVIVLLGSKADMIYSEAFLKMYRDGGSIIDLSGRLNIDELKAFMARLEMFISVDTGPIYIGEALNIKTIDIVGPMDENEQPPRGPINKIVKSNRKCPQLHIMNSRVYDKVEARRQVESITANDVYKVFKTLM